VVRGDVHPITLPRGRGRVQDGRRFAVIVQADDLLALSVVEIGGNTPTRVMCEMVGAVDARMLGERVAHLTLDEMRMVDEALELVLDLD
jgi:mRNA-degrading endonuclease toxin of MazEF toxin-antitoxin module